MKVGVRPEKITIEPRRSDFVPGVNNSITGVLRMSTYIGVSHQYKVEGPGGTTLTVYIQNLGAEEAPRPGERVVLFLEARAHVRGGAAGRSLVRGGRRMTERDDQTTPQPSPEMNSALMRGMTQRRMSRRNMIKYAGMGVGGLSLASILAACGGDGSDAGSGAATAATVDFGGAARRQHQVRELAAVHRHGA